MENSLSKTCTLLLTIFPCYVAAFLFRNIIAHFTWNISKKQCFSFVSSNMLAFKNFKERLYQIVPATF